MPFSLDKIKITCHIHTQKQNLEMQGFGNTVSLAVHFIRKVI